MDSKSFFKSFAFLLFLFLSFSCSENKPQIYNVFPKIIVDPFSKETPIQFSVFTQITSEPRRIKSVSVVHLDSGLFWQTDSPLILYSEDYGQQFIGYSSFMPSYESGIPKGRYNFIVEDMAQNILSTSFYIMNNKIVDYDQIEKKKENIAVYTEDDVILYVGKLTDKLKSASSIKENYESAFYFRYIYLQDEIIYLAEKEYL